MPGVRALDDRDLDAVARLHHSVGWTPPTLDVWAHLWRDNPARIAAPDTARGRRPSFTDAMEPTRARELFDHFCASLRARSLSVATGRFGAAMHVDLVNEGPVTILLDTKRP